MTSSRKDTLDSESTFSSSAANFVCLCWRNAASCLKTSLAGERSTEVPDGVTSTTAPVFDEPTRCLKSKNVHDNRQTWPHFLAKKENMIVTKEPVISSHLQLPTCNNNHLKEFSLGQRYLLNDRAKKYLIDESHVHNHYGGHSNLAYDSHDTLEFDESYGFSPFGDHCIFDPGYGSERSEEEESNSLPQDKFYSPSGDDSPPESLLTTSMMPPKGIDLPVERLMGLFPFINEGTVFDVTIIRNSRGLGLAVTGGVECDTLPLPGLIRVKKLYPQTPAWLCGQLHTEDFLLEANGKQLTGLTSHEALEVLRTTGTEVHLVVCRAPLEILKGEDNLTQVDRRGCSSISANIDHHFIFNRQQLSPSSSFSNCGEFEIQLKKVAGSLGFTLRKNDNSILGHTIRSLVKEPALSDGRIRPGDKLVSVNGTDMCGVSHEEAVRFLRTCPDNVVIKLYRDAMQTPVSPASPTEPDIFAKPKQLRKEARDMLSDLAFRKQSSPLSNGNQSTDSLPSRRRRFNKTPSPESNIGAVNRWESLVQEAENDGRSLNLDDTSPADIRGSYSSKRNTAAESAGNSYKTCFENASDISPSNSFCSESRPSRPNFLDLSNTHSSSRKSRFTPPHEEEDLFPSPPSSRQFESLDSVPQLTSTHSDTPAFSHLQPGYRSVNLSAQNPYAEQHLNNTSSDHNIHGYVESPQMKNTLLKWKGVLFTPEDDESTNDEINTEVSYPTPSTDDLSSADSPKSKTVIIDLSRGWNSRLGFSLQGNGDQTTVIAIYEDSIAAKDGRLKVGDVVLEINDIDVQSWSTESIIDLLRKIKGKVFLKVIQKTISEIE